jgi:hypothetical protein
MMTFAEASEHNYSEIWRSEPSKVYMNDTGGQVSVELKNPIYHPEGQELGVNGIRRITTQNIQRLNQGQQPSFSKEHIRVRQT